MWDGVRECIFFRSVEIKRFALVFLSKIDSQAYSASRPGGGMVKARAMMGKGTGRQKIIRI